MRVFALIIFISELSFAQAFDWTVPKIVEDVTVTSSDRRGILRLLEEFLKCQLNLVR